MAVFTGHLALITGGASGIGAACARLMAERGGNVVVADRDLAAAEALIASLGGNDNLAARLDVADVAQVHALFTAAGGPG